MACGGLAGLELSFSSFLLLAQIPSDDPRFEPVCILPSAQGTLKCGKDIQVKLFYSTKSPNCWIGFGLEISKIYSLLVS